MFLLCVVVIMTNKIKALLNFPSRVSQFVTVYVQQVVAIFWPCNVTSHVQMNVSQEEYERMYGVYLRSVEENRRRRYREQQREMELEDLGSVTAQRFYSFTHTGKYVFSAS